MEGFFNIDAISFAYLLVASLVTSLISAMAGFGGGILLLVVMASFIDPTNLIAVHGLVQLGTIISRAWLFRRGLSISFCRWFLLGGVAGAFVFYHIAGYLSPSFLQVSIGLFVLITTWIPASFSIKGTRSQVLASGAGVAVLALCVGAVGPVIASILRSLKYAKTSFIATLSFCFLWLNVLKVGVYSALGFSSVEWLPIVLLMILMGVVGTWVGSILLGRINEQLFGQLLKILLTGLAVKILWQALIV